jgi:hypothetical protein
MPLLPALDSPLWLIAELLRHQAPFLPVVDLEHDARLAHAEVVVDADFHGHFRDRIHFPSFGRIFEVDARG